MKMRFLIIVLLFSGFNATNAQISFLGRFLSAVTNDSLAVVQKQQLSRFEKPPFSLPLISDVEFKVRNRAFDFGGQRYTISLEPRGFGETKAANGFWKTQAAYEGTINQYNLNEQLLLNYIYFIDMLERKSLADGYRDLIPVFQDRIDVMEKMQNSTDFDLTELVKTEKDLAKLLSEKIEEEQEVKTANRYMRSMLGDTAAGELDTAGLIPVELIKEKLAKISSMSNEENIYLKNMRSAFEYSQKRFELEKAQNRKYISSLEFSYDHGSMIEEEKRRDDHKNDYNLNNAFIMEIGIKLSMLSSSKDDAARREIDYMHDKEEYAKLKKELGLKKKKDYEDIVAYIERYELVSRRETEADAEASLKKYMEISGVDPLVLLEIKESLIKNRMEKEKIYFSILRNFIYVMDVNGKLLEKPIRNLLSAEQEVIAP